MMSWDRQINFSGLVLYVSSSGVTVNIRGPVIGFFIEDETTIQAITENDPRVLEALKWIVSTDAHDYCEAQWVNYGYWQNKGAERDIHYEENLRLLLLNRHLSENARTDISERLAKIAQKAAKKHHTKRRRSDFQQKRDHLILALIERDGYICAECDVYEGLTIDHILPLSKGGSDELKNLRFLCRSHNSSKGDR